MSKPIDFAALLHKAMKGDAVAAPAEESAQAYVKAEPEAEVEAATTAAKAKKAKKHDKKAKPYSKPAKAEAEEEKEQKSEEAAAAAAENKPKTKKQRAWEHAKMMRRLFKDEAESNFNHNRFSDDCCEILHEINQKFSIATGAISIGQAAWDAQAVRIFDDVSAVLHATGMQTVTPDHITDAVKHNGATLALQDGVQREKFLENTVLGYEVTPGHLAPEVVLARRRLQRKEAAGKKAKAKAAAAEAEAAEKAAVAVDSAVELKAVTDSACATLAHRACISRISNGVKAEMRSLLKDFLRGVLTHAVIISESGHRVTVERRDLIYALRLRGMTLYDYKDI